MNIMVQKTKRYPYTNWLCVQQTPFIRNECWMDQKLMPKCIMCKSQIALSKKGIRVLCLKAWWNIQIVKCTLLTNIGMTNLYLVCWILLRYEDRLYLMLRYEWSFTISSSPSSPHPHQHHLHLQNNNIIYSNLLSSSYISK